MSVPTNVRKFETSPEAQMHGQAMQAFFNNMRSTQIDPLVKQTLADYDITQIQTDEWYPSQVALDLYRRIVEAGWGAELVAIGMGFVEAAPYPDDVDDIAKALSALNEGYSMGIRNYPEEEGYTVEVVGDRHVRVYDHCPYPHDIMYGYIYGIARRFAPTDNDLVVEREYMHPDDPDAGGAVYNVTW